MWSVKCDIALPCATQNELLLDDAKALVANGCKAVCEGANMPTTIDATKYLQENGVWFIGGKAANAGGVATSALEMTQNSERLSWTFEEVDSKLQQIMVNIYHNIDDAAKRYGQEQAWGGARQGSARPESWKFWPESAGKKSAILRSPAAIPGLLWGRIRMCCRERINEEMTSENI